MQNSGADDAFSLTDRIAEVTVEAACSKLFQATLNRAGTLCVALSGGLDSMVLLDAAARLRETLDFKLVAAHINHDLSPNAAGWAQFCQQQCDQRGVPLRVSLLALECPKGASLEAVARTARYAALSTVDANVIALAQHQDDQSETFLLQLLRGAGMRGLSAMAKVSKRDGIKFIRPFLDMPSQLLEEYARQRNVQWVEDESNAAQRFDRNYLRHEILPRLKSRFPGYRATLARAARHAVEAEHLLQELADLDLAGAITHDQLACERLRALSSERAKNALRIFLQRLAVAPPSGVRLDEILRQLVNARPDANVEIHLDTHILYRFRDQVWVAKRSPKTTQPFCIAWSGEPEVALPDLGGVLRFDRVSGAGVRLNDAAAVTIRSRQAGEHFQPECARPHRSLKNLFQEAAIPPWQRANVPFVYVNDTLVAVPGLGVACDYQVVAGEQGWAIRWEDLAAP